MVGLILPEILALGAAIGLLNFSIMFWNILLSGSLTATLDKLDVASSEILLFFFWLSITVRGPGQKYFDNEA